MPTLPQLETDRLVLTIPGPKDAEAMLRFFLENRAHLDPWDPPHPEGFYTKKFWVRQLELSRREWEAGKSARFGLRLREDPKGPIVGRANYSNIVRGVFQSCFLGYSLDGRLEGKGYMSEALRATIDYAFYELRLHRIQANYIPTNERSGALLRRLGFNVEGYARDYLYIRDGWKDHVLTALLNPDKTKP